jgi:hypothetical protein
LLVPSVALLVGGTVRLGHAWLAVLRLTVSRRLRLILSVRQA